jgi:deazaflavin-dependent oxidoreductase (nitroreductase family)
MPVLLLTVAGRKTGTPHTVPCVYVDEGGSWLVCGSAGGAPEEPQWFRNLRAADRAEVEVEGVRTPVRVKVLEGEEHDAAWRRLIAVGPFFAGYQKKVDRVIPLAVLTPVA